MIRLFLSAFFALVLLGPAGAHPHIFVDGKATLLFDAEGRFAGVRQAWTFDEAFSAWAVQGLDTNGDGAFSEAELAESAQENIQGLSAYQFYTYAGERSESLRFVSDGPARIVHEDGRNTLHFTVRPEAPYAIQDTLEVSIADPEYYIAIAFDGVDAITMENAPGACALRMEPPKEMPPEIADQLYSLPPDVTELPPALAAALRGVQGAILVSCPGVSVASGTALEAANEIAATPSPTVLSGPPAETSLPMPRTGFFGWINEQQRNFYLALTGALGRLQTDGAAFWVLGSLSFLYGGFHAAGPGHGKLVIGSYMLANEVQVRRGIGLSFVSAMLQSLVAIGFVLIAAGLLNLTSAAMSDAARWIELVSYGLVALLGLWLLARKLFGLGHQHGSPFGQGSMQSLARAHLYGRGELAHAGHVHPPASSHVHEHHHHAHDAHEHPRHASHGHEAHAHHHHVVTADLAGGTWREQLGVVLSVGLRPCSGALVVLVFALSQNVLPAGIAAVLLMGLGTALTVGLLATLSVSAKTLAARLLSTKGGADQVFWWAEVLGAAALFIFGVMLFGASL